MITSIEKKQLKKIIGTQYTDDVLEILNQKTIRNRNGHPHNAQYILQVFNGIRSNSDIEAAIWELASIRKAEAKEMEKLKKQILN
jgi:hypothetical protein